jgi:hypothetical protein
VEELKMILLQYGDIEILKAGEVFSVVLTGKNLSNWRTVDTLQSAILNVAAIKYPTIEALKIDDHIFVMILRKP